jgi:hypothetical protein
LSAVAADKMNEFKLAPEYRRSALYMMVGSVLFTGVAWWVESTVRRDSQYVVSIGCALLGVSMIWPLAWRLELDGDGLARRRLWFFDRWNWEDFGNGQIQKGFRFALDDRQRPWWRRKLDLEYLTDIDRSSVLAAINEHYRLTEPPDRLDELSIKYAFRKTVKFGRSSIQFRDRGQPHDYRWADVRHLRLARLDALRRDFYELDLVLPDREIALRIRAGQHGSYPSWRGAPAEALNEFLLSHLPSDVVSIDIHGARPRHPIDIQRDLNHLKSDDRQLMFCLGFCSLLLVGDVVFSAISVSLMFAAIVGAIALTVISPVLAFGIRERRARQRQLESWLGEAESVRQGSTPGQLTRAGQRVGPRGASRSVQPALSAWGTAERLKGRSAERESPRPFSDPSCPEPFAPER